MYKSARWKIQYLYTVTWECVLVSILHKMLSVVHTSSSRRCSNTGLSSRVWIPRNWTHNNATLIGAQNVIQSSPVELKYLSKLRHFQNVPEQHKPRQPLIRHLVSQTICTVHLVSKYRSWGSRFWCMYFTVDGLTCYDVALQCHAQLSLVIDSAALQFQYQLMWGWQDSCVTKQWLVTRKHTISKHSLPP